MMAKLILTFDDEILGEYQLDHARTTIGRRSVSNIHIDHMTISGEHAVVLRVGHDFIVEDVGSTNGTRVNGKLIKQHVLHNDDVIGFGKYQLKFINPPALNSPLKSDNITSELAAEVPAPISAATVQDAAAPLVAKIKLLNGANAGHILTLNKAMTTLGKVGAQVAVITKRPAGYFISHIEGKIYPVVNDNSIGPQAFPLNDRDIVELAGVKMEFYFEPLSVAPD